MTAKELNDYKQSLEGKTLEELEALEQEVVKEADKLNEEMSNAALKVPTKNYKEAAKAIRRTLNKQSIQWQYALGMIIETTPDTTPQTRFISSLPNSM